MTAGARSAREARIWGVLGASGTGKGLFIKQHLRTERPARLVVWDFLDEYREFAPIARTLRAVQAAMIRAGEAGPLRVRYVPRSTTERELRREFEGLCSLVYAWESCTFVAEELANVTTPGWAPPAWRKMTTSGRHAGVHVLGTSQTPAMIDKAFLGNCTLIHCCALREHAHRVAVARSMDIDTAQLAALLPLEWVERDWKSNEIRRGRIEPPRPRAPTPTPRRGRATGAAKASHSAEPAPVSGHGESLPAEPAGS